MHSSSEYLDRVRGCLLGIAVGDSLGLPREGLTPGRAARLFGSPPFQHRFIFGRGMISDDTEHACMTAQALLASAGEPDKFARSLAWRLRFWLLGLPAGIGFATLRSITKLWLGILPKNSGVYSAGCGPAMRAPVIGGFNPQDEQLILLNRASSRITHTDPRAEEGSLLIALVAREAVRNGTDIDRQSLFAKFREVAIGDELLRHLDIVESCLARGDGANELINALGLTRGVTGYINHVVPVSLFCWLRYPGDFRKALETAIIFGGDTDTVGAIVGGLIGATLGEQAIPAVWRDNLVEWPRSITWMRQLAERLTLPVKVNGSGSTTSALPLFWPGIIPRNIIFLLFVLLHGFRRIFPPYR